MEELLQQILQECRPYTGQGALASYIPELARQDPDRLGIAVFHKDGTLVEAGDSRRSFTIQSVMKPLSLLLALQDNGRETVRAHVGVEATGKPFDAINVADNALLAKHLNPMVNAGAILMCQLIGGETYDHRFQRLLDFIRRLTDSGITVSIGHTSADAETVHAAADHGATHVTHTFNAQTPLNHRAPGVPGAAMVDDRLNCEVISDGIHLHPDVVRLLMRCKGKEHTVAITDAMEAAGMPDGKYQLGGQDVFVKDGAARLADGTLAGSTLTMLRAFQNLIRFGASPEDAALMTTRTPAQSILNDEVGEIELGAPAIFARFDKDYQFVGTIG